MTNGGAGPTGQLDCGVTHRPSAASHEHDLALQGARLQPARSVLGHRQGPVGGHGGDAEAGPDVEADAVGEPDDAFGGQVGVLLRSAGWPLVAGKIDPDPVTNSQVADPFADGVDHTSAVLVRCHLGEGRWLAWT